MNKFVSFFTFNNVVIKLKNMINRCKKKDAIIHALEKKNKLLQEIQNERR